MESQFKNLTQLLDFFKDEETCKTYLATQRWDGVVTCPFCESEKVYVTNRGFKCGNKDCHKKFSVTVGTIYENSKIPLRTWFAAMYLITAHKKGISSLQLSRDLGITQKTAWFVLHRVREMLIDRKEKLSGTVEIDESYFGGKQINKHKSKQVKKDGVKRMNDKTPVLGIVEGGGKVYAVPVKDARIQTTYPIISDAVEFGSTMYTDEWQAYKFLKLDYNHAYVNHSQKEYVRGAVHTQNIENFWSIMKRVFMVSTIRLAQSIYNVTAKNLAIVTIQER